MLSARCWFFVFSSVFKKKKLRDNSNSCNLLIELDKKTISFIGVYLWNDKTSRINDTSQISFRIKSFLVLVSKK